MPKVVDHDQRRAEIIGALWEVIGERGTEGASLMTVARAAGVSVGRIQHYFFLCNDNLNHLIFTASGLVYLYRILISNKLFYEQLY